MLGDLAMEGLLVHLCSGIADDGGFLWQQLEAEEVEEGRVGLLLGQVSRGAENCWEREGVSVAFRERSRWQADR